jgi:hypothetical protein
MFFFSSINTCGGFEITVLDHFKTRESHCSVKENIYLENLDDGRLIFLLMHVLE